MIRSRFFVMALGCLLLAAWVEHAGAQQLPGRGSWAVCTIQGFGQTRHEGNLFATVTLTHLASNRTFTVTVDNEQPDNPNTISPKFANLLRELRPNDFVEIRTGNRGHRQQLRDIRRYNLQPGEELPGHFVYVSHRNADINYQTGTIERPATVQVRKLGENLTLTVPNVRRDGDLLPDPDLMAMLMTLRRDDVVMVRVRRAGEANVINHLQRYHPTRHGEFVESFTVGFNPAKPAVRISADDGTSFSLVLPGRMVRDEWVADPRLMNQIERLERGDRVTFDVHEVGNEMVLRAIRPGPPRPRS
ncbi:MAG: hypothetical protein JJU36_04025 [Phycisphaeraceae bacterium]|nr:hypothetical protein [Phycisphaeraceae bacterium]